jgi:hypothetical protein
MTYKDHISIAPCHVCGVLVQTAGGWHTCKMCRTISCNQHARAKLVCQKCLGRCSDDVQKRIIRYDHLAWGLLVWGVILPLGGSIEILALVTLFMRNVGIQWGITLSVTTACSLVVIGCAMVKIGTLSIVNKIEALLVAELGVARGSITSTGD